MHNSYSKQGRIVLCQSSIVTGKARLNKTENWDGIRKKDIKFGRYIIKPMYQYGNVELTMSSYSKR
jgi:hypothetical protein